MPEKFLFSVVMAAEYQSNGSAYDCDDEVDRNDCGMNETLVFVTAAVISLQPFPYVTGCLCF